MTEMTQRCNSRMRSLEEHLQLVQLDALLDCSRLDEVPYCLVCFGMLFAVLLNVLCRAF
jgi:hypothetical protein